MFLPLLFVLASPFPAEAKKKPSSGRKLLKQTRITMGTFAEISLYFHDEKKAGKAAGEALDEIERMDHIMSNYKKTSELSFLNNNAAKSPVSCSKDLFEVIEKSYYYSELSNGAFDITVFPLIELWGFFREEGHIPSDKEIHDLLPAVSYKNIVMRRSDDPEKSYTVFFQRQQTRLDLGGIGKGYAVDKALEVIKKHGIDNACINLGGNIYVLGAPDGKSVWKIGVQHPRNNTEILGYLELSNEATATSGDYERFFEIDGERHTHIIDPRSGMPVRGVIATTIIAPTGTDVDALSTIVFVLGTEKGLGLIHKIPGAEAMIIHEGDNEELVIDMTGGFKEKFKRLDHSSGSNIRWRKVTFGKQ